METITLESQAEFDAVIAALRLLATRMVSDPDGTEQCVGDILTCSGDHAGLTVDGVHDLADRLLAN
jgi:hypothetical protein